MKVCTACKEEVPDDTSGACLKCNAMDGYTLSKTWTFRHKIEGSVEKYDNQIE